jgi:hypothetical protein
MKIVTSAIVALFATAAFAAGTGTATAPATEKKPEAAMPAPGKEMAKEGKTDGCTGKHGKALKKCEADMKKTTTK